MRGGVYLPGSCGNPSLAFSKYRNIVRRGRGGLQAKHLRCHERPALSRYKNPTHFEGIKAFCSFADDSATLQQQASMYVFARQRRLSSGPYRREVPCRKITPHRKELVLPPSNVVKPPKTPHSQQGMILHSRRTRARSRTIPEKLFPNRRSFETSAALQSIQPA